jgi:hypothetical protein
MTTREFADKMNGREYGSEITREEEQLAKENGLVIVFGYSDDNMEFRGAINDEVGCYDGGEAKVTEKGILGEPPCSEDCDSNRCPYYASAKKNAKTIRAVWCAKDSASWTYKTDIPHETFNIFEDGELFCIGIVFALADCA